MTDHRQKAIDNFYNGYNCSQSVFLAFTDLTGFDPVTALKISSCFGGGMCRLRETCGAVSGIALVYGTLYGNVSPLDHDAKCRQYADFQSLAFRFRQRFGSFVCRELLKLDHLYDDPAPEARTPDYYKKRRCAEYIGGAAEILDSIISERENNK